MRVAAFYGIAALAACAWRRAGQFAALCGGALFAAEHEIDKQPIADAFSELSN